MCPSSRLLLAAFLCARCQAEPQTQDGNPPPPSGPATDSTATTTFALDSLLLGETNRDGGASSGAWKAYGYNLDGLVTTKTSADVCTLHTGAPLANQVDADAGVDNAFGQIVAPIIETGASIARISDDVTGLIASGAWTLQVQVTGLTGDVHQTATGLRAQIFVSGSLGAAPAFDSSTDWPVLPSSLSDGATVAGGALVTFATAYVADGTFVARDPSQPVVVPVQLANATPTHEPPIATLVLRIRDAILTFDAASGDDGVLAGVVDGDDAVAAAALFAHQLNSSMCGDAFLGIADQIRQAEDILSDGTNRAGVTCDAISLGIGFTAKRVANPTKVGVDPPPPNDPCDAGAD